MAQADTNNWKNIWDGKGRSILDSGSPGLLDLVREDGFDSGAGDHCLESWLSFSAEVYRHLGVTSGTRLLEVGCGCGAFLYPADQLGAHVSGIDYSHQLVAAAHKAIPRGNFLQAEACALPYRDGLFDVVLCHSVFQYFSSEDYALRALCEMLRIADQRGGRIGILDINDADKEADFLRIRSAGMGLQAYREKYADYPHRFYRKAWFENRLQQAGYRVTVADQSIAGYQNSALRFNVFATRAQA